MNRFYLLILFCLNLTLPAYAEYQAALHLNLPDSIQSNLQVGMTLPLEITISGSDDSKSSTPSTTPTWTLDKIVTTKWFAHGPVLIDFYSLPSASERANRIKFNAIIVKSGNIEIPPIPIREETSTKKLLTNGLSLKVNTVLTDGDKSPLWTLPPIPYGDLNKKLIIAIGIGILIVLIFLIYKLFLWIKNRERLRSLSAIDLALQELHILDQKFSQKPEITIMECKEFSFGLSAIIRRLISKVFQKNFLDDSDREFTAELKDLGLSPQHIKEIESILEEIKEVRYNKKSLANTQVIALAEKSKNLMTRLYEEHLASQKKGAKI